MPLKRLKIQKVLFFVTFFEEKKIQKSRQKTSYSVQKPPLN